MGGGGSREIERGKSLVGKPKPNIKICLPTQRDPWAAYDNTDCVQTAGGGGW